MPKNGRKDDSLSKHLERQIAAEIGDEENISNPRKFALQMKYGLEEPELLNIEKQAILKEEFLGLLNIGKQAILKEEFLG